jgi:hypothetical protein
MEFRTIDDIKEYFDTIPRTYLTPNEVALVIGCAPQSIRSQAQRNIADLGFPASKIGTRLYIPKDGFLEFWQYGLRGQK